ncbi:FCGR3 protein, partial [Mohoua ochrocephala]|nr:FCGR3 protein [Mohoua ochrocephala]
PPGVTGAPCPTDRLVLQVPAWVLLEGDTVTLRCQSWQDRSLTGVRFHLEEKDLRGPLHETELSLSPVQLHHGGRYCCGVLVYSVVSQWRELELMTVTVHSECRDGDR